MTDTMQDVEAVKALANLDGHRPTEVDFRRADLRAADLSGVHLSFISLAHARLDRADLRGAQLWHVDLTGASLAGARLDQSRFEAVSAGGARLTGAGASRAFWEQVDLTGADLSAMNLRGSTLRGCGLESAKLDGADLTLGSLAHTNCTRTSFRGTVLHRTNAADATFSQADIFEARDFFHSREIVVEALRRGADDDLESMQLIGAAAISNWCYRQWHEHLLTRPDVMERALEILGRYQASGAMEALRDGWSPGPQLKSRTGRQTVDRSR